MSWNKSGDERARSYQVYKDLLKTYRDLQVRYDALEAKLAAKDETLMRLAGELHTALHSAVAVVPKRASVPVPEVSQEQRTPIPEHRPSAVVTRDVPSTMAELLGTGTDTKRREG